MEPMDMVSSSGSASDDNNDELLNYLFHKKLCVLYCMAQHVPECTSECLKLPKFPEGALPQTPLEYTGS